MYQGEYGEIDYAHHQLLETFCSVNRGKAHLALSPLLSPPTFVEI